MTDYDVIVIGAGLGGSLPTTLASGVVASDYIIGDHA